MNSLLFANNCTKKSLFLRQQKYIVTSIFGKSHFVPYQKEPYFYSQSQPTISFNTVLDKIFNNTSIVTDIK